ncbi:MAG: dihydrofolate reductase [Flavobacteriales bacterium]|jgi:dihydrofolate reductase
MVCIIVAAAKNNVIGNNNELIWHLSADLKRFKALTTGHHIIMGRKTFESIGKPLPNRTTVIITRNPAYQIEGCITVNSLEKALEVSKNDDISYIIGGAEIYKLALPLADKIELTRIEKDFEGDAYFPEINESEWSVTESETFVPTEKNDFSYRFDTLLKLT